MIKWTFKGVRAAMLWAIGVISVFVMLILGDIAYDVFFASRQAQITLIPDGYVGPVVIWFGGENSMPPQYENGARVFVVPETGILRRQAAISSGSTYRKADDDRFFYVKKDGSRTRLPVISSVTSQMREDELNRISVYGISSGRKPVRYSTTTSGGSATEYFVLFIVGKPKDRAILSKQVDAALVR